MADTHFNKIGLNVFYVIMKGVPAITNFKWPIYQTFNSTNLIWKWCKCEILIIDTWNEYVKKGNGMLNLFFYHKFNVMMPIFFLIKNLMNLVCFQKQLDCHQHNLNKI